MYNDNIYDEFIKRFNVNEYNSENMEEEKIYDFSHNKFMEIAEELEIENPKLLELNYDDAMWYDEYREDVVNEYIEAINLHKWEDDKLMERCSGYCL